MTYIYRTDCFLWDSRISQFLSISHGIQKALITYCKNRVQRQVGDDIRPRGLPMRQDFFLFHTGIPASPSEVSEKRRHLVVATEIASDELAKARRESARGYEQRHDTRV